MCTVDNNYTIIQYAMHNLIICQTCTTRNGFTFNKMEDSFPVCVLQSVVYVTLLQMLTFKTIRLTFCKII
jgi:hypothetical protein